MSIQFSDTSTRNGIVQLIERNCGYNAGDITGNSSLFADFTADINLALDKAWSIILQASGTWQIDDSNYTDYPIITTNLVSGQRDYSFTADGSGALVLDIYRVMVADTSGIFHEIYPVDQQSITSKTGNSEDTTSFYDGRNASGIPSRYDKTGNAIFLDVIPNYNSTGGLKVFIDREAQKFTTSDTTKKPGFAGIFHEYLALRPSYMFAYRNGRVTAKSLQGEMLAMERAIEQYYTKREKDKRPILSANIEDNR